jgi:hypothetical protein
MSEKEAIKNILKKYQTELISELDLSVTFIAKLYSRDAIDAETKDLISMRSATKFTRITSLLESFEGRGSKCFKVFVELLGEQNEDLAKLLSEWNRGLSKDSVQPLRQHGQSQPQQNSNAEKEGVEDSDFQEFQPDGKLPNLKVNVKTSSMLQIKESQEKTAYPIDIYKANGRAYIINVNKVGGMAERSGTNRDRDYLEALFKGLAFEVTVYNDKNGLSKNEIEDKVRRMAEIENQKKDAQCFVLCILSHGETLNYDDDKEGMPRPDEGCFYGTDEKLVKNDTVFQLLNDENCPALRDKPRLIFFQTCRCNKPYQPDDVTVDHFLVGYPTQKGHYAFRYPGGDGSVYMRSLVQEFMTNACKCDVKEMLDRVANDLKDKKFPSRGGEYTQVPETVSQLKGKFYFIPRDI